MMKNKTLFSVLIVFLFILSCDGDILTFYDKHLTPQQIVTYSDNSAVFRLIERLNDTCNVPNLTYGILYPNGTTSNVITVHGYDHQIPHFNFCTKSIIYPEDITAGIQIIDHLYFETADTNYIFVIYDKVIEGNSANTTFGMMIDWSGNIRRYSN
jgi:hypothetical protein